MNINICPLKFLAEEPLVKLFFIGTLLIFNLVLFNALGSKFKKLNEILFRKCEDNSLVVWKEVSLDGVGDRGVSESQNEVQLLSLLQHPSTIAYYTHFVDPRSNALYIEMEYAEHGTLPSYRVQALPSLSQHLRRR